MKGPMKILLLFCSLVFISCNALADSAEQAVEKAYYNWCSSMGKAKGNPHEITQYYAPDATLLPTLSPEILKNTKGGLNSYFIDLTSYKDLKCTPKKLITAMYGDKMAVNVGFYDFSFIDDKTGKMKTLPARFTFVYEKIGDQWLIVSHHSSVKP